LSEMKKSLLDNYNVDYDENYKAGHEREFADSTQNRETSDSNDTVEYYDSDENNNNTPRLE
jgi:hypothetical protein